MDSHALVFQGGTPGPGGGQMLGQEVVEAVVAERTAALIEEQRVVRFATAFPQPCPQRCRRVLAQRRTPLLSSLAVAAHMGAGAELDVLAAQTNEFRGPQSGLHRHQQQGAVAPSRAGLRVRRPEQNVDLVAFEKGDGASSVAFVRNGQNPLGQRGVAGLMQGDEAEERTDGGQAGVAGARVVAAFGLEMAQEVAEQGGVEVIERHRRGRLVPFPLGVAHQQTERRAIARDGVRARLTLLHEALGKEPGQQAREVGGGVHGSGLRAMRSRRRAASCSSSGVAVRYQ